jgi:hypothetical protein
MIIYEWQLEEVDECGDIIDQDFSDTITWDCIDKDHRLCLVRRSGDDKRGCIEDLYAYVYDGELPNYFEESEIKVPKKYQLELNNWLKRF